MEGTASVQVLATDCDHSLVCEAFGVAPVGTITDSCLSKEAGVAVLAVSAGFERSTR